MNQPNAVEDYKTAFANAVSVMAKIVTAARFHGPILPENCSEKDVTEIEDMTAGLISLLATWGDLRKRKIEVPRHGFWTLTLRDVATHRPPAVIWEYLLAGLGKAHADDQRMFMSEILNKCERIAFLWCLRLVEDPTKIAEFVFRAAERVVSVYEARYPTDTRIREGLQAAREGRLTEAQGKVLKDVVRAATFGSRRAGHTRSPSAAAAVIRAIDVAARAGGPHAHDERELIARDAIHVLVTVDAAWSTASAINDERQAQNRDAVEIFG